MPYMERPGPSSVNSGQDGGFPSVPALSGSHIGLRRQHRHRPFFMGSSACRTKGRTTNNVTARVVERTDKETLQGFVNQHTASSSKIYTDEVRAYDGLENRKAVKHSVKEYVNGQTHTNGVESFWSMLKQAHKVAEPPPKIHEPSI